MSKLILLAAAALVVATPALAQDAAPAPSATEAAPTKSADELAIEAQAREFSAAMEQMQQELIPAATPEEGDAIVARYQPMADALADRMNAFLVALANQPGNEAQRDELLAGAAEATPQVRRIPGLIRTAVDQGKAQAQPLPEATPAPAPAPAPQG